MPLIGRAWKANVNAWKRHLTLQSVFNRGEWMMHVDKNADGHVMDQNVDRISREIAYVPLSGRIRSKRSSCMQPFFFFWKKNEYKTCLSMVLWIWSFGRASQRSMDLKFGHASQRSDGLKFGCASQRSKDWILDVLPRGPWIWIWICFPEVRWIEVWTYFPEVRWFGILDVLPKGPRIEFWTCFPKVCGFEFGRASQRSDGLKFGCAS